MDVQLSGDDFTNKLNGGFNQDGRTGYKEDEEHTMTIFYMERGMSESNLKIRYNFPVEANFGKMKIREITDYSAVNAGLQALTEKASEDDVFQYTVKNTETNASDVLKTGDKAPTTKNFVRNVQGTTTQLTSSSSTSPSAHSDGETAEQGQFFDPNNSEVKGVSYNWVDGYAADPGNTAIVMSSDENVRAITDSGGNMYLMHGTNSVKSSGEFEGQFSRYSTMQITQGTDLYKPDIHTTGGAAADLATSSARAFDSFYKIDKVRIFTTTQVNAEFKLENGDQFTFRNDLQQTAPPTTGDLVQGSAHHEDSSLGTTVQMTETFYNSPLLGAMTITKQLDKNDSHNIITEPFTLRLKLTSIFGNSTVNVGNGQYEDIVAYKYDVSGTSSTPVYMTTGGDSTNGYYGEFTLSPGEILAIENIPVGTHYSVEEVTPTGAYREDTTKRSHVAEDIVEGVIEDKQAKNSSHNATVDNAIIVNTRVTNKLKLVKEVTGSRAGTDQKNKTFNFTVVLEAPEGVTFKTGGTENYPITIKDKNNSTISPTSITYSNSDKKCTIVIPVSHNGTHNSTDDAPITISGVPYDTKYTVTETIDSVDQAFWTLTGATGTEGTIIGQCTTKITNYFDDSATISLSKVDRTTKRIISGNGASGFTDATFKLLELKTTPDWTDSSVLTAFSNMINAANYTPAADSTYVEAVYPSDSSVLTATNGELVINDSTANVTISAGKKYFFYEVSAPTGYRADNKLSADRTIVTLTTGSNEVIIPNSSASVTVQKQNESGQGLPDAELDLYIHDVTKTETVNPSDVSSYETVEAAVPGDNHTSALPVLYTTNNNKISYTWSETADDPDYYNIKFINQFTDNSSWSTVKAVFIDSSNGTHEVNAESSQNGVFKFKNNGDYSTVYFTDGTNRTVDITLEKYNDATNNRLRYGYGYTYKPAQLIDSSKPAYAFTHYKKNDTTAYDGQYLVQIVNTAGASVSITTVENTETNEANRQYLYWEPPADYDNKQYCWFYQNGNGSDYIFPDGQHHISSDGLITWNTGKQGRNGRNIRGVKIPPGANYVKFCCSNNAHYYNTGYIQISSIGVGKYLSVTTIANTTQNWVDGQVSYELVYLSSVSNGTLNDGSTTTTGKIGTLTFTNTQVAPNEINTQLSASFQPEDRYGLISSVNSGADSNNMITIVTALATPYIDFFAETDGTGGSVLEDGAHPKAATGMSLKAADLDRTQGSPYKIRIPKNAKSFKIYQGSKLSPAPIQSAVIPLYVNESGHHYHEAGTTFNFDSSATLTSSTRRLSPDTTKVSISPSQLTTRTDVDYIYFTDVGGRIAGASGQVYAYYFGGVDGAYFNNSATNNTDTNNTDTNNTSWGGVSAQYTYTDNNGNKVYVFQPPKAVTNGTYPYVIFNNGGDCTDNTTIAAKAVEWTSGHNYSTTSSTSSIGLGSIIKTYDCIEYAEAGHKTDPEVANGGTTNIYIKNNGTDAFNQLTETRYVLDDIHVEFFSNAAGTTAVGQTFPGYRPVKVMTVDGCDIYRMAIPDGATYFRINNGQKKTNGTTKANYRRSEIRSISANAMYKFVDDTTTPSDIWNHGAAASNAAELDDYFYYLDIVNKTVTTSSTDVKLATVVTGSDGEQAYIKWLTGYTEANGGTPASYTNDDNYLDHVIGDIGQPASKTVVNVVKKQTGTTANDIYYYWKESKAPDGYSLSTDEHQVSYDSNRILFCNCN